MEHLTFQQALEYLKGQLPPAEIPLVQTHLAHCEICQKEVAMAQQVTQISPPLEQPPQTLLNRLTEAFRRRQTRPNTRPSLPALLQFDSWSVPTPLGVRGGALRERQLLFNHEQYDLDLQIVKDPGSNSFQLLGQLLSMDDDVSQLAGFEIQLLEAEEIIRRVVTDELGQFVFQQLPAGVYSLLVQLDQEDLVLEALEIQEHHPL